MRPCRGELPPCPRQPTGAPLISTGRRPIVGAEGAHSAKHCPSLETASCFWRPHLTGGALASKRVRGGPISAARESSRE
eukprot:8663493-Pyramimonas_sp.AAC.1